MLACVCVFFNPVGYKRNLSNYFEFRENFTKRIPLYVVEASFSGQFETDADFKIRANPNNQWMWQKERMINWVVEHLPDKYDRYMYSDCDLLYEEGWDDLALNSEGIVQCFKEIDFLDSERKILSTNQSGLRWMLDGIGNYGSPGGCWIYPRDVKQYDRAPVGAGDSYLERALVNKIEWPKTISSHHEYIYYMDWCTKIPRYPLSYLPIKIQHLYHGSRKNRQYVDRHSILKKHNYHPLIDIQVAKNGLFSWCSHKPEMHMKIKNYFSERREDD